MAYETMEMIWKEPLDLWLSTYSNGDGNSSSTRTPSLVFTL